MAATPNVWIWGRGNTSSGAVLEEFAIAHQLEGFAHFFARIGTHHQHYPGPVAVAMEGYNGYARPLDPFLRTQLPFTTPHSQ